MRIRLNPTFPCPTIARTFARTWVRHAALGALITSQLWMAQACSRPQSVQRTASLKVDLITDYDAPSEFASVEISLSTGETQGLENNESIRFNPTSQHDLGNGVTVARLPDLPLGNHILELNLLAVNESLVLEWRTPVFLTGDDSIQVILTRGCKGDTCQSHKGLACDQCIAGICVSDSGATIGTATVENISASTLPITACSAASCEQNSDCPTSSSCAESKCFNGACLQLLKPEGCESPFFCNPNPNSSGCQLPDGSQCGLPCIPEDSQCQYGFYKCEGDQISCDSIVNRGVGIDCDWGKCDGRGGCEPLIDPNEPLATNAFFGEELASTNNQLFIGASQGVGAGSTVGPGTVYVAGITDDGSSTYLQRLDPSEADDKFFGIAIAVDDSHLLVGAYDTQISAARGGSAYLFAQQSDGTWVEESRFHPAVGMQTDRFGFSVAMANNWYVIGAPQHHVDFPSASQIVDAGVIYIQDRSNATFAPTQLKASDADVDDAFGWSVASSGNWVASGAFQEDSAGTDAGAVYLFEQDGTQWNERAKITGSTIGADAEFGTSVAMEDTLLAVGAPSDGASMANPPGKVFIFERSGTTWSEVTIIERAGSTNRDGFGTQVVLQYPYLAVSEPGNNIIGSSGKVHLYKASNSATWNLVRTYTPQQTSPNWGIGGSLTMNNTLIFTGSPGGQLSNGDDDVFGFFIEP